MALQPARKSFGKYVRFGHSFSLDFYFCPFLGGSGARPARSTGPRGPARDVANKRHWYYLTCLLLALTATLALVASLLGWPLAMPRRGSSDDFRWRLTRRTRERFEGRSKRMPSIQSRINEFSWVCNQSDVGVNSFILNGRSRNTDLLAKQSGLLDERCPFGCSQKNIGSQSIYIYTCICGFLIHIFFCFPVFRCVAGSSSHGCPRPFLLVTCFLPTNVLSQGGGTMGRWALNQASLAGHGRGHRWGGGLRCSSWLWLCFPGVNMFRIAEQVQRPARLYQYSPLPKKKLFASSHLGVRITLMKSGFSELKD